MNPDFRPRITLFDFGLSDVSGVGSGVARQGIDPGARLDNDLPPCTLGSVDLLRVDFLKMDIVGAELMALRGGQRAITPRSPGSASRSTIGLRIFSRSRWGSMS